MRHASVQKMAFHWIAPRKSLAQNHKHQLSLLAFKSSQWFGEDKALPRGSLVQFFGTWLKILDI